MRRSLQELTRLNLTDAQIRRLPYYERDVLLEHYEKAKTLLPPRTRSPRAHASVSNRVGRHQDGRTVNGLLEHHRGADTTLSPRTHGFRAPSSSLAEEEYDDLTPERSMPSLGNNVYQHRTGWSETSSYNTGSRYSVYSVDSRPSSYLDDSDLSDVSSDMGSDDFELLCSFGAMSIEDGNTSSSKNGRQYRQACAAIIHNIQLAVCFVASTLFRALQLCARTKFHSALLLVFFALIVSSWRFARQNQETAKLTTRQGTARPSSSIVLVTPTHTTIDVIFEPQVPEYLTQPEYNLDASFIQDYVGDLAFPSSPDEDLPDPEHEL
ncbi:hypothetical protein CF326_g2586 [Tilletia indica]|nr:hypothetical protein CF326_g2586 [Tilletia indica]